MNFKIYNNIGVLTEVLASIKATIPSELNAFRDESFAALKQKVKELSSRAITIDYGWVVNIKPGEQGQVHNHPTYPLVAVYYVNVASNCGDLVLHDKDQTHIVPCNDSLIIFPGHLYHHIETNNSSQTRTSIGMHLIVKPST